MKWHLLLLSLLIQTETGFTSGRTEEIDLRSRLRKDNPVFAVRILGSSSVRIKELGEAADSIDPKIADQHYYSAKILEIVNKGEVSANQEEFWTMLFPPGEEKALGKIRTEGVEKLGVGDTVFIMDLEDLSYSYMYYVEGKHKIFYYYQCPDAVASIKVGKTYIFVSGTAFSPKNGVLYGNVDYGLYPDTREMRRKIAGILKESE